MKHSLSWVVILFCLSLTTFSLARPMEVNKTLYFERDFSSYISHINVFNENQIIILSQGKGVILDSETKIVEKEFEHPGCGSPVSFFKNDELWLLCPGRGFSKVWAGPSDGEIIWQLPEEMRPSVFISAYDPIEAVFYTGGMRGLHRIGQKGKLQLIDDETDITDIRFPENRNAFHGLTLSKKSNFFNRAWVDFRDRDMALISRTRIDTNAKGLLDYGWPDKESLLYYTNRQVLAIDAKGEVQGRVSIGQRAVRAEGAPLRIGNETFFALIVRYSVTVRLESKLIILNSTMEKVYEEELPHSWGLGILPREEGDVLLIGEGTRYIYKYEIRLGDGAK